MCTHGDHAIGLEAKVFALSNVCVLKCFDDYALMLRELGD